MAAPDWEQTDAYWEKLVSLYKEELLENPHSYVYVPLADALAYLGRIDEAIEVLTWGLGALPDNRSAKVMLAQLLYDIGDIAGARLILEDVTNQWPDVTAAVGLLCKIYESGGEDESAMIKSSILLKYYPDSAPIRKMVDYYKARAKGEGLSYPAEALAQAPQRDEIAEENPEVENEGQDHEPAEAADGDEEKEIISKLEDMLDNIERMKEGLEDRDD